eukprot:gnl/MRDRNA2_/MRDRNA2_19027_c0_seq1.p1 gnl/MRDRNA2_/MRDRNA2_19027_c0~~gnl/MRDRNA2_/MRDRNA2_19027_c0_seq1.p1  ORF type:complete len:308 (+),score=53.89 gnl/MRDRNA2_/MRDRNA2_19027_c0_seq1:65-988(+)
MISLNLAIFITSTWKASAGRFDGKVCYITGGTSGLGLAAVEAAAAEGCKTVFTGRRVEKGEAVAAKIKSAGGEATFIQCDVKDAKQVKASIDQTVKLYGSLNYAFNNAGGVIKSDSSGLPHEVLDEDFDSLLQTNLNSVFYSVKYEVQAMLKAGISAGSIVNCASILGSRVELGGLAPAYTTSKHGMHGLTKTFAAAYAAKGIRINDLSPAYSISELTQGLEDAEKLGVKSVSSWHPAGRWLKNSEVVDGLFWLWSEQSSFYNGQDMILDSGLVNQFVPNDISAKLRADIPKALADAAASKNKAQEL